MLNVAKNTQGINSGCSSNDNMASDFSTPHSMQSMMEVVLSATQ